MTVRTDFADRLVSLDARETRARLAEALAAVKGHRRWAESRPLQDAVSAVEAELLTASRLCIQRLAAALVEADRPPTAATLAEAHADIVAGLDADAPPARASPPAAPVRPRVPPMPPRPPHPRQS